MTVRAKFYVTEVAKTTNGSRIRMQPVVSGSDENKEFFKWTPSGQLDMGIVNEAAAAQFEPGVEYYLDFTLAPKP